MDIVIGICIGAIFVLGYLSTLSFHTHNNTLRIIVNLKQRIEVLEDKDA